MNELLPSSSSYCPLLQVTALSFKLLPSPSSYCPPLQVTALSFKLLPSPSSYCPHLQVTALSFKLLPSPSSYCPLLQAGTWKIVSLIQKPSSVNCLVLHSKGILALEDVILSTRRNLLKFISSCIVTLGLLDLLILHELLVWVLHWACRSSFFYI